MNERTREPNRSPASSAARPPEPGRVVVLRFALAALLAAAPVRADEEQDLIAILKSDAAPAAKCDACTRLKIAGSVASVPALAALLTDERTSHAARNALESMPEPEAGAALREAFGRTSGLARVGVMDSLGRRRDTGAVALLAPVLRDVDAVQAAAAASALGRIGGREALAALTAAQEAAPETVRPILLESLLQCGESLHTAGDAAGAVAVGRSLLDTGVSPHLRAAAWRLVVASDAGERTRRVSDALTGGDRPLQVAAIGWLRESADLPLLQTVLARWDALPAEAQLAAMDAHLRLGGDAVATVRKAAGSPHALVKRAAWAALAGVQDPAAVAVLAGAAAGGEPADRDAAREALARIHGPGVREAMIAQLDAAAPAVKAELLTALGTRGDREAVDVLIRHAAADDDAVRTAALKSLRALAVPSSLAPLLDLAVKAPSADRRTAALQALQAVGQAAPDKAAGAKTVLDAIGALDPANRAPMLVLLPGLGTAEALDAAKTAAASDNADLAAEGVRTLARWPDASAAAALLDRARSSAVPSVKILAARGVIDLAGREPDLAKRLDLLRQAMAVATRPDEKKQALGLVGAIHTPAALELAVAALSDAALVEDAGLAAVGIAETLAAAQPQVAGNAAAKVAAACKGADTVRRAKAMLPKPAAPPVQAPPPPAPAAGAGRCVLARSNLVAWCIVPFDAMKRSPEQRAEMLVRLGLTRCAYDWRKEHVPTFEREILAYRKHGIEFFAFWSVHEAAFALFEKHGLRPQIWVTLQSPRGDSDAARVEAAGKTLLPLVERTRAMGCKLGLYNHGGWGGEPENMVAVCEWLRRTAGADHVGIVYNFHHGHGHIDDWPQALAKMKPYLLCLNLNGMNEGANPKILPIGLGRREKDMIRAVLDSGYAGPVGILDHRPETDSEQSLRENLEGLAALFPESRP